MPKRYDIAAPPQYQTAVDADPAVQQARREYAQALAKARAEPGGLRNQDYVSQALRRLNEATYRATHGATGEGGAAAGASVDPTTGQLHRTGQSLTWLDFLPAATGPIAMATIPSGAANVGGAAAQASPAAPAAASGGGLGAGAITPGLIGEVGAGAGGAGEALTRLASHNPIPGGSMYSNPADQTFPGMPSLGGPNIRDSLKSLIPGMGGQGSPNLSALLPMILHLVRGNGGQSDQMQSILDLQRQRMQAQNPLFEAASRLAFQRLPTSAQAGLPLPSMTRE